MDERQDRYREFFVRATGFEPYPYQVRLACGTAWPELISAPTGAGKTAAVVLAWLWRHVEAGHVTWEGGRAQGAAGPRGLSGWLQRKLADRLESVAGRLAGRSSEDTEAGHPWPRRLVYCLPMRSLVEQTWRNAVEWLDRLSLLAGRVERAEDGARVSYEPDLADRRRVTVHLLMGGEDDADWDVRPEGLSILVGTQDMLLSRALNRGYAMSRFRWPLQFGLLNNDVLWVLDEVQLMGHGLSTACQLQAFRSILGTYGEARTTWMSATLRPEWLRTRDLDPREAVRTHLSLESEDLARPNLRSRMEARKVLTPHPIPGWPSKKEKHTALAQDLARWIAEVHEPGTKTLVVLNRVDRAQALFSALRKVLDAEVETLLLHSRFRPPDRERILARLVAPPGPGGLVAVTTQVVEAGLDVSAKTLITDLAPWPSLVQRFGRCNRKGEYQEARIFWLDPEELAKDSALPYEIEDLQRARTILREVEEAAPARLPKVEEEWEHEIQIRRKDILELFDTTPDLSGADIDVSPYVRGGQERDVSVFWRSFDGEDPPKDEPPPCRDELCRIPVAALERWLKKHRAWRWDHVEATWQRLKAGRIPPGLIVLLRSEDGGYDPERGWTGQPSKKTKKGFKGAVPPLMPSGSVAEDGHDRDLGVSQVPAGSWQTLAQHTDQVVEAPRAILEHHAGLQLPLEALLLAARWHDAGKAHPVFQEAMREAGPPEASHTWAKAVGSIAKYGRPGFRHELASAAAMLRQGLDFLAVYLAAAHHGKVRLSVRSMPHEEVPEDGRPFARGVWHGDRIGPADLGGGVRLPETDLNLEFVALGRSTLGPSWVDRSLGLLEELGPFRLAFLEALLRVADWRASAGAAAGTPRDTGRGG